MMSTRWPSAAICATRSIQQTMASVIEEFGQLDLLVNNAGIFESEALEDISVEQWDAMFATNTRAPFLMAKAAHPYLRAAKGRILNIALSAACTPGPPTPTTAPPSGPAHALEDHGQAWAPEITSTAIAPA